MVDQVGDEHLLSDGEAGVGLFHPANSTVLSWRDSVWQKRGIGTRSAGR